MPRIMIRTSDRRILFFSHADLTDLDPLLMTIRAKYPDDTSVFSPVDLPSNIRLGGYLDTTRTIVEHRPHGHLRTVDTRRAELDVMIDGHIASITQGALLSVPVDGQRRFHRYLRMLVQASLRDDALRVAEQWALIQVGAALQPWDFVAYTSGEDAQFRECFGNAGAYAVGWWNGSTISKAIKAATTIPNPMLTPSQAEFDFRAASIVELIPASEIDRTDTTLRNDAHPWTERVAIEEKINARLPWYQPSSDATLAASPITSTVTGISDFSASLGYYTVSTTRSFIAFRPAPTSSRATMIATVNGNKTNDPTTFNAALRNGGNTIVITVTAQDQETTMSYTYEINRTSG